MASITALLHTENDGLRLGRALETLYACDDIVVVDHASTDGSVRIAREYGATIVSARPGASAQEYLGSEKPSWIFCLDPHESLTEKLAASLFEWKSESLDGQAYTPQAFSVFLREETTEGWIDVPAAQTRLVPPNWNRWAGNFPADESSALPLKGELLRFVFP